MDDHTQDLFVLSRINGNNFEYLYGKLFLSSSYNSFSLSFHQSEEGILTGVHEFNSSEHIIIMEKTTLLAIFCYIQNIENIKKYEFYLQRVYLYGENVKPQGSGYYGDISHPVEIVLSTIKNGSVCIFPGCLIDFDGIITIQDW